MASDGTVKLAVGFDEESIKKAMSGLESSVKKGAETAAKSVAAIGAGLAAVSGIIIKSGVEFNSQVEQYQQGFKTMLGSAQEADKLLSELKGFAQSTPFELADLANASTTLLGFGENIDNLMPDLKMLGDISLGNSEKFKGLALVFGQVQSQGRLMGQDLLQMINQGFNPLLTISEKTGKSVAALKEEMSEGLISFEMVADAMRTVTSEGGRFYNAIENQSKTLAGQFSTLKDGINSITGESMKKFNASMSSEVLPALNKLSDSFYAVISGQEKSKTALINNVKELSSALQKATPELIKGIGTIFENVALIAPDLMRELSRGIINSLPIISNAAGTIFKGFIDGLIDNTPQLTDIAIQIGLSIVDGIVEIMPRLVEAGGELVSALLTGLVDALPQILGAFGGLITSGNTLVTVVTSVAAAFAVFKTMTTISGIVFGITEAYRGATVAVNAYVAATATSTTVLPAFAMAVGVVTGKITLSTAATAAWNAALTAIKANPVIAVVSAIGLAIAGIGALSNIIKNQREELEKQRQDFINSGEAIQKYGESLEKTTDKLKSVKDLAEEYKVLKIASEDLTLSESERLEVESQLKSVTDELIANSGGIITAYDAENGLIEKRLPMLQRTLELEQEMARLELEEAMAGKTEEAYQTEINNLTKKEDAMRQVIRAYEVSKNAVEMLRAAEAEAYEYGKTYERASEIAQYTNTINEAVDTVEKFGESAGLAKGDVDILAYSMSEAQSEVKKAGILFDGLVESLDTTSKELNTTEQSLIQFQINSEKLKSINLQKEFDDLNKTLDEGTISQEQYIAKLNEMGILIEEQAGAQEDANGVTADYISTTEELADAQKKIKEQVDGLVNGYSELESSYKKLSEAESLSADELSELISLYPEIAEYIAQTGDLTLQNGNFLKTVTKIHKSETANILKLEAQKLASEIDQAKKSIEAVRAEYAEKARTAIAYYKSLGVAESDLEDISRQHKDAVNEALGEQSEHLNTLEQSYNGVVAQLEVVNNLNLESIDITRELEKAEKDSADAKAEQGKASKKAADAAKDAAEEERKAFEARGEASEEYVNAVTKDISDAESATSKLIENMTAAELEAYQTRTANEQEAADRKAEINDIAFKKLLADTAETESERIKLTKEYEDALAAYIAEIEEGITAKRQEELDKVKESYDELSAAIIEALKEQYRQAEEVEQYYLDKSVEANKKATDSKIAEYDREYTERLKLIDEEAYEQAKALQDQIDAIDAQEREEEKRRKKAEDAAKMQELTAALKSANDPIAFQEAFKNLEAERTRQAEAQKAEERDTQKELLRAEIEGIKAAAEDKKKLLDQQNADAQKALEEQKAYYAEVNRLEILIATEKNEELVKLYQKDLDAFKAANADKASISLEDNSLAYFNELETDLVNQLAEATTESERKLLETQLEELRAFKDEFFKNVDLKHEENNQLLLQNQELLANDKQKALVKAKYDGMNEEESLGIEAQRIIIEGGNDEIIKLLESYNPKWQDAGKSFGEKLIAGLQSTIDAMKLKVGEIASMFSGLSGSAGTLTAAPANNKNYLTEEQITKANAQLRQAESLTIQDTMKKTLDIVNVAMSSLGVKLPKSVNIEKQEININQPVKSPAETSRAVENASKDMAYGF